MDIISQNKERFEKALQHFIEEIHALRTGRANAALVENINIMAYGSLNRLKNLASIVVLDPKTLKIEPWDKNIMKEIEKGIAESSVGLNPQNEGNFLRISLPPMTEENRKELIRVLNQKAEGARIALRQIRDELREHTIDEEKAKRITEDDKYLSFKKIDEVMSEYNLKVKDVTQQKEKEILTI